MNASINNSERDASHSLRRTSRILLYSFVYHRITISPANFGRDQRIAALLKKGRRIQLFR
ncbi:hypothetical protein SAMCCGM7_Ch2586 [Sinorhizobium americanum CCGM7]|nr:hypothetical protein SAMCCGM7_Ch2586 [Sinorhizobium americanum CCGM7]